MKSVFRSVKVRYLGPANKGCLFYNGVFIKDDVNPNELLHDIGHTELFWKYELNC